ncbi:MAG: hypothetical protein HC781_19070 [Leptolyngbyaceae cyanobacterium CSU_1_4]|nr:hypothetical protein [Leptolyngbyaceae cyanobacterium CSU_1_4]
MTGFIRGLFGSKSKRNVEEVSQPQEAFYLPDDDAKTFGDIDYMRSSKKTRRTFPKKIVGEDNEFFNEVSSTQKYDPKNQPTFSSPFNTTPLEGSPPASKPADSSSSSSNSSNSSERRRSDSSMDMFRNMARDIKKKG